MHELVDQRFCRRSTSQGYGSLSADIYLDGGRVLGEIANGIDQRFDQLILYFGYFYQAYENVNPGDRLTVDFAMDASDAAYMQYNGAPYLYARYLLGRGDWDYYGYSYRNNTLPAGELLKSDILSILFQSNVMINTNINPSNQSWFSRSGDMTDVLKPVIYAFNTEQLYPGRISVNGKEAAAFSTNVFYMEVALDPDRTKSFALPYTCYPPTDILSDCLYDYYRGSDACSHGQSVPSFRWCARIFCCLC